MSDGATFCVYGAPPAGLADTPAGAVQVSPGVPGASRLEDLAPGSLSGAVVAAPPGAVERRYTLALALRALKPGAPLTALAPKDKGGARLRKELEAFGCSVEEAARQHQRICHTVRPQAPIGPGRRHRGGRTSGRARAWACGPSPACSAGTGPIPEAGF